MFLKFLLFQIILIYMKFKLYKKVTRIKKMLPINKSSKTMQILLFSLYQSKIKNNQDY